MGLTENSRDIRDIPVATASPNSRSPPSHSVVRVLPPWSDDFLYTLFQLLGGFSLSSCSCVCKRWNLLIDSSFDLWTRLVKIAKVPSQERLCFSTELGLIFSDALNPRQLYQKYFALSGLSIELIHSDTHQFVAEYELLTFVRINNVPLVTLMEEYEPECSWDWLTFDREFIRELRRHVNALQYSKYGKVHSLKILCLTSDGCPPIPVHVMVSSTKYTVRWTRENDQCEDNGRSVFIWNFNRESYLTTLTQLLAQQGAVSSELALANRELQFNTSKYF